jgi:hypothetical protein
MWRRRPDVPLKHRLDDDYKPTFKERVGIAAFLFIAVFATSVWIGLLVWAALYFGIAVAVVCAALPVWATLQFIQRP